MNNKELAEKLINVYVNHEIYKTGNETAIETLNRYMCVLYELDMLPQEVIEEVKRRKKELMAK